jgi:N-methylhydantoinase A
MLGFGELAGDLHLDVHAARACLQPLAEQLRMSPEEVASGIVTIITAKMANAIRTVTIEEGQDPRTSTLIAFGGAGPVFATLLARELEIRRILIPRHAGNFSAWGLLTQDVVRSSARTMMNKLDETGLELAAEALQALFDDLEARASGRLSHGGMSQREAALDLRYVGQEYTRSVPIPLADGQIAIAADAIRPLFAQEYEQVFGHLLDAPIELVGVRATTRLPLTRPGVQAVNPDGCEPQRSIDAYSFTKRDWLPFSVLERSALGSGDGISGPAILLEPTATTYIDAGYDAEVDPTGALFLTDTKGT